MEAVTNFNKEPENKAIFDWKIIARINFNYQLLRLVGSKFWINKIYKIKHLIVATDVAQNTAEV